MTPAQRVPTSTMNISVKTLWLAIHRIFSNARIGAGCSIDLRELMTAWAESGLRQSDLARGLETLTQAGHMRLESTPHGPVARLIDEQFGLLRPGSQDQRVVASLEQLRQSRKQRCGHLQALIATPRANRRAEDRSLYTEAA